MPGSPALSRQNRSRYCFACFFGPASEPGTLKKSTKGKGPKGPKHLRSLGSSGSLRPKFQVSKNHFFTTCVRITCQRFPINVLQSFSFTTFLHLHATTPYILISHPFEARDSQCCDPNRTCSSQHIHVIQNAATPYKSDCQQRFPISQSSQFASILTFARISNYNSRELQTHEFGRISIRANSNSREHQFALILNSVKPIRANSEQTNSTGPSIHANKPINSREQGSLFARIRQSIRANYIPLTPIARSEAEPQQGEE